MLATFNEDWVHDALIGAQRYVSQSASWLRIVSDWLTGEQMARLSLFPQEPRKSPSTLPPRVYG